MWGGKVGKPFRALGCRCCVVLASLLAGCAALPPNQAVIKRASLQKLNANHNRTLENSMINGSGKRHEQCIKHSTSNLPFQHGRCCMTSERYRYTTSKDISLHSIRTLFQILLPPALFVLFHSRNDVCTCTREVSPSPST